MTDPLSSKPPFGLRWRSHTLFILSTVSIGLFTDLFLYGLIVPILPFLLSDRLSMPSLQIQSYTSLLLACYAGASVLFSLPAAIIADHLPARQLPFLAGLAALLASSTLLFLGESLWVFVLARILQGISASVVWTIGLAFVLDTVGSAKLGVTIGSIFSFISVGELAAPVLGGVVYKKAGNAAVFSMVFALLVLDFMMRVLVIEKKTAAKYGLGDARRSEDRTEENGDDGEHQHYYDEETPLMWHNGKKFNPWKIKKAQPSIVQKFPILYCLSDRRLLVAQAVAFMQATLLAVFDSTIPTEAYHLFGFDSLKSGLLFIPLLLPYLILGPLFGQAVDKYGVKPAAVIGMGYFALPLILLRIPRPGGQSEILKFATFLSLSGLGFAIISAPSIVEASYVTEQYHRANREFFGSEGPYAQLYAINFMVFSAGLTFGPLLAGGLRDSLGYGNMNAVVAGMCIVVGGLSFVYLGGRPRIMSRRRRHLR